MAEHRATLLLELRDRLAAVEQRISELEGNCPAKPDSSAPTGSLVEVVKRAIGMELSASAEARAAILAVANWLDTRGQHGCSLWLREEVERHG